MNIWILAVILGFALMLILFFVMVLLDAKKGNITYIICQTFLGGQKWYMGQGKVDIKNDGSYMAEHVLYKPKKLQIGLIHQKFLKPQKGNRYLIVLEEWDTGRFRPLDYRGHMKGRTTLTRKIMQEDNDGNPILDPKTKEIQYSDKVEVIDYGTLIATPNHDIDYIVQRKDKNRQLLLKKQEANKWLPMIIGGALFVIVGVMLVVSWMYLAEFSANLKDASKNFASGQTTENTVKAIRDILLNESITRVKDTGTASPPSAQGGG